MRDSLTIDIAKCYIVEREEFGTTTDGVDTYSQLRMAKKKAPKMRSAVCW